ncbi:MAG: HD-GYP domain-containing protein [Syntrophomonadaceae bacterium]
MRRVPVEDLQPGMVVARTVMGFTGRALLTENTRLTDNYIARLGKIGIGSVYIKDGLGDGEVPELVSEAVLFSVTNNLNSSLKTFTVDNSINVTSFKKSVKLLLENILNNPSVLIQLEDIRSFSDYVFTHSTNVAVYSIMAGISLGYSESSLADLGLGALLHDIGMLTLDAQILTDPEALSIVERDKIKLHPELGFNLLRQHREISALSAHVAYQHHERVDGKGYPRGLNGDQILDYAKIVAVTDTFDAVISDRPHRTGCTTTDAMVVIKKLSGTHFDPVFVEAFASNVALYPVGSVLKLNTGHLAVVTSVNRFNSDRPRISVICSQAGDLIKPAYEIDLAQTPEISVMRRLTYEETQIIRLRIEKESRLDTGFINSN